MSHSKAPFLGPSRRTRMSRWPSFRRTPVRTTFRSTRALVDTVEPWTIISTSPMKAGGAVQNVEEAAMELPRRGRRLEERDLAGRLGHKAIGERSANIDTRLKRHP